MATLKIQSFSFCFGRQLNKNHFYSNLKNSLFSVATLVFLLIPLGLNASESAFCWKAFPSSMSGICHDDKAGAIADFQGRGAPYSLMNEEFSIEDYDENVRYNYKMTDEPVYVGPWTYRVEGVNQNPLPTFDNEQDAFDSLEAFLLEEQQAANYSCFPYSEVWPSSEWQNAFNPPKLTLGYSYGEHKVHSHLFYRGDYYTTFAGYIPCTAHGPGSRFISRGRTVQCPQGALQIYDPDIEMCVNRSTARVSQHAKYGISAPPSICLTEGNPCSPATGAKTQTETDYSSVNGTLRVERTFNSQAIEDGYINMGPRWRHNYTQRLNGYEQPMDEEGVKSHPYPATLRSTYYDTRYNACTQGWQEIKSEIYGGLLESGIAYYLSGVCEIRLGSKYVLKLPIHNSLNHKLDTGTYSKVSYVSRGDGRTEVFRYKYSRWQPLYPGRTVFGQTDTGWSFTLRDNTFEQYDTNGKLILSTNQNGQSTSFSYDDDGRLHIVTGHYGDTLTYEYDDSGFLTTIVTPDGDLLYSYDTEGRLIRVTYPDNRSRQYHYENTQFPYHLTGITDEKNNRFASWAYDSIGKAILSEHSGGAERVSFTYNSDGTTTVTDAAGAERIYHFTVQQGQMRVDHIEGDRCTTCSSGDIQAYTYDNNGFIASKTDWNGNTTTYTRDDQGRELSRTEASGTPEVRTIITTWDITLNKPLSVTGPEHMIEYTYDGNGRMISAIQSENQ
ncbi:MAG: DUF6531 domain-containing protein [Candidatus Thiodiazotropha lotti]|uniref:DUF6531 domain-containing protein n=1 Tax=Candidatus Thiodiazotropha lotti TaxID=2792787 RepID=A0A9E4K5E7_9GAMM|nr:DUF6531 domain-containing protein [Candidatus Thiodiazotropha lotti]MCW4204262.1 DUF6531 domain-containing protein [Candidatus Thiodiazotropha lotti]